MEPRVHYHVHKNPQLISVLRNPDQTLIIYSSKIIFGASAKQRNTTISLIILSVPLSVRPFVCVEQLRSRWTRFSEILFIMIFVNLSKKRKFFKIYHDQQYIT
jgi:hypothetical protein